MEEILRNCKPGLKESKSARIEEVRKRLKVDNTDASSEDLRVAFCGPLYPLHKRNPEDEHSDDDLVEKKLEKPEDEHGDDDDLVEKKLEKPEDEHGDEDPVAKKKLEKAEYEHGKDSSD